jgi:hypothetical protein
MQVINKAKFLCTIPKDAEWTWVNFNNKELVLVVPYGDHSYLIDKDGNKTDIKVQGYKDYDSSRRVL